MKTKTLIELITLTSSLYVLGRDTHILEKINEWTGNVTKDVNNVGSETILDKDGNQLELINKIKLKAEHLKEELETRIEEAVTKIYKKMNIAHLDEIKGLQVKIEKMEAVSALLEARINQLESKL